MRDRRREDAKIHLEIFGQPRVVETVAHEGSDCTPLDLWETARGISAAITAASIEQIASEGRRVTCSSGCAACCRPLIPISPLEATMLLRLVEAMPEERRASVRARFADAVKKMEEAALLDRDAPKGRSMLLSHERESKAQWDDVSRRYWALQIACPFLENESCGVYEDRPMICREYNVTTPATYCASLDERTRVIPWPVRMSEVLATVGGRLAGIGEASIPLALALEWAEAHGEKLEVRRDGEEMFRALVQAMEERWEG